MRRIKNTLGETAFLAVIYFLLSCAVLVCLYPMLYVLFASLSDPLQLATFSGIIWRPLGFSLKGYELVMQNPNIYIGYGNTLLNLVVGTTLSVLFTSVGAYVLSRRRFMPRNAIMMIILITMYFSGGMIPLYLTVRNYQLMDNRFSLILPTLVSTYNLIVMRTGFASVPDSLEESAKLDGANDLRVLFQIYFPVSKAIIAVIVLFYAVEQWNLWFNAMLFIRDRKLFPLQLILREILISNDTSTMASAGTGLEGEDMLYKSLVKYCTIIVATVPILLVYPFLQKYFVKGVMIGSVKG
jgi:putative aldouronate transport system permease protein